MHSCSDKVMLIKNLTVTFVVILLLVGSHTASNGAQPAFTAPASPWSEYREVKPDPDIGPPYLAYHRDAGGVAEQQVIAYRLVTAQIAKDKLGDSVEQVDARAAEDLGRRWRIAGFALVVEHEHVAGAG